MEGAAPWRNAPREPVAGGELPMARLSAARTPDRRSPTRATHEPVFRVKCADFLHFESHIASEGRRTSRNTIQVAVFRPLFGQTSRSATGGRSRVKDNWGILVRPCLQSRRDHGRV